MNMSFSHKNLEILRADCEGLNIPLRFSNNISALSNELPIGDKLIHNRIAVQPMEGCDAHADGSPGELTVRRYRRFAASGAALIWGEATAISAESKSNPHQLMITKNNIDSYKKLVEEIRDISFRENGFEPYIVLQLTHSGRYSKPNGIPAPIIAGHHPIFEREKFWDDNHIATDEYLKNIPEQYAASAKLCEEAGFDGIDIKTCHGYLLNELLGARGRKGIYGGSFENRSRLILDCFKAVKSAVNADITTRISLYDGFDCSENWGVDEKGEMDLSEPIELICRIRNIIPLELINCTMGNPYQNPHINRPFAKGGYIPPENPLIGVSRILCACDEIKKYFPDLAIIASGFSYLQQFSAHAAAALIEDGGADMAGFGRMSFACGDFARRILNGSLEQKHCCLCCGKCSELMRSGGAAGCVVRDGEVYAGS